MKAIMLAAGKSTRTYPLTLTRPKPLLPVAGTPIIEHNLNQLKGLVSEVIIIVGFGADQIKQYGSSYKGIKLTYIEQDQQLGTGDAVQQARDHVSGRFIVMNGDDLYFSHDIRRCLKHKLAVMGYHMDSVRQFGALEIEGGKLAHIAEKSDHITTHLVNTGFYVLHDAIFAVQVEHSPRGEIELTEMVNQLGAQESVTVVQARNWFPIGYPWDLVSANAALLSTLKTKIDGKVEKGVTISGAVRIGKGTEVKPHTHIEGPVIIGENCVIGPHAYIRPETSIGNNCRIRAEVVDSVILDNTTAKHHSYLGHSVVGEHVNIAAGTITADYRHDAEEHTTIVNGEKVDTGRTKLGAFIGDRVKTGINTCIYPGRKIWAYKTTLPGQLVTEDIT